jgi:hypothetical protein
MPAAGGAHRWFRLGRNLNQIEFGFTRQAQRFRHRHDADVLTVFADHADFFSPDLLVDSMVFGSDDGPPFE